MRLFSSDAVVREADLIGHKILQSYAQTNRSKPEIRDLLANDSIELFADFGDACRAELRRLQPNGVAQEGPSMFRPMPMSDMSSP